MEVVSVLVPVYKEDNKTDVTMHINVINLSTKFYPRSFSQGQFNLSLSVTLQPFWTLAAFSVS
jgi:hypothetical protein